MAIGEYGPASGEEMMIMEQASVPAGMLNEDESTRFNVTIPEQMDEQKSQEEESSGWPWLLGLLLFAL